VWDLDTIKALNAEQAQPRRKTGPRQGVFEIREGVYALGYRGARAIAVVARIGYGQYRGVRGRHPLIGDTDKRIQAVSDALVGALNRVAARAA
jgi:hypothetical protein